MTEGLDAAPGDIRALKYRIHELEGEVIGYKRILDDQAKAVPVEIAHVMQQALEALCLPCDRWNGQQTLIVNAAIGSLRNALDARETK